MWKSIIHRPVKNKRTHFQSLYNAALAEKHLKVELRFFEQIAVALYHCSNTLDQIFFLFFLERNGKGLVLGLPRSTVPLIFKIGSSFFKQHSKLVEQYCSQRFAFNCLWYSAYIVVRNRRKPTQACSD